MLTNTLDALVDEQLHRYDAVTGLSGSPTPGSVPTQWRGAPRATLARVRERGGAALAALATRVGAATVGDVAICVLLLAVLPRLACAPTPQAAEDLDPTLVDDVHTFGVALLGYNPGLRLELRPRLVDLLPPGWRDAVRAARRVAAVGRSGRPLRGCARPNNAVLRVALLALAAGVWTPDRLADVGDLSALERVAGWDATVGRAWRRGLRACVDAASGSAAPGDSAAVDETPLARVVAHLIASGFARPRNTPRGLRHVIIARGEVVGRAERDAKGAVVVPDSLADVTEGLSNADREILLLLTDRAPRLAELATCERVGGPNPGRVRPATSRNLTRTLDRLAGQYLEAEDVLRPLLEARGATWYSLRDVTPTYLLSQPVPARLLHVAPPVARYHESVEASLAQAQVAVDSAEPEVSLALYLFDRQAPASWANSPEGAAGAALTGYTQTLLKDARDFAHGYGRWVGTATPKTELHAAFYARMREQAHHVIDTIDLRTAEAGKFKDVAKLLTLVTWPLLLGPGLECLRRAVHRRRRRLKAAGAGGPPEQHLAYVELLEAYLILAVFCVDPLRFRNVREGCVGREIRLTVDRRGASGRLLAVQSEVGGGELKQGREWQRGRRAGRAAGRASRARHRPRRSHRWSPYVIDLELLWEYLTMVRCGRLPAGDPGARHGPLAAGAEPRPLFLSESTPGDVLGDDAIRDRFARALHYVCVEALGCDLGPWSQFKERRGSEWFALFSPHVVRSLVAIYWRVVREHDRVGDRLAAELKARLAAEPDTPGVRRALGLDADDYVAHLTTDTRRTLDRQYVVRPAWLTAALDEPLESWAPEDRWRHPRALDLFVDLAACAPTRIVEVPWRDLPLPPACRAFWDHDDDG